MQLFILIIVILSFIMVRTDLGVASPVRIALTIDDTSKKDFLIIAHSVVLSSLNSSNLYFHVVVCGINISSAVSLRDEVAPAFSSCLPGIKVDFIPFMLPLDSGFALQRDSVTRRSHWYSPTGADMARFFLANIFPDVEKLLYLDNDIVVSCCVEEVWNTDLGDDKIVGIALDDLKWATVTQFNNQYNASHPLVIQNVRRKFGSTDTTSPVSVDEFWKALPRYPNDGVLLIHVPRYNAEKILARANAIALANSRGEYVVGLGTQQFTVLMMHDRWVELTPRANLRHFPDMARGYLMWFYYHGIIHFAGMVKPRNVCFGGSDNEHRVHTYTPWATNIFHLHQQCPTVTLIDVFQCAEHIPVGRTFPEFLSLVEKIIRTNSDVALLYLRIGAFSGANLAEPLPATFRASNFSLSKFASTNSSSSSITGAVKVYDISTGINVDGATADRDMDGMEILDRLCAHHSPWSGRVFDADSLRTGFSAFALTQTFSPPVLQPAGPGPSVLPKKGNAKKSKVPPTRFWKSQQLELCDGTPGM